MLTIEVETEIVAKTIQGNHHDFTLSKEIMINTWDNVD